MTVLGSKIARPLARKPFGRKLVAAALLDTFVLCIYAGNGVTVRAWELMSYEIRVRFALRKFLLACTSEILNVTSSQDSLLASQTTMADSLATPGNIDRLIRENEQRIAKLVTRLQGEQRALRELHRKKRSLVPSPPRPSQSKRPRPNPYQPPQPPLPPDPSEQSEPPRESEGDGGEDDPRLSSLEIEHGRTAASPARSAHCNGNLR